MDILRFDALVPVEGHDETSPRPASHIPFLSIGLKILPGHPQPGKMRIRRDLCSAGKKSCVYLTWPCIRKIGVLCRLSNKKYRLPNNMRRCQALPPVGLRLISWRDIIFFLCVFQSLVLSALFLGPMPLYVAEEIGRAHV